MRRRTVLGGIIVAASLAIAGSASAQTATWALWKNANTTNGTFYMGVAGGPKHNAATGQFYVDPGTQIITFVQSFGDQYMGADTQPVFAAPTLTTIVDFYKDSSGNFMCLAVSGGTFNQNSNANIVVTECQNGKVWNPQSAEDLGAPYPGCFLFNSDNSNMVLSVFQGSVKNGSRVVQFPKCAPMPTGNTASCGFAPNAWHADQFWCPVQPTIVP